MPPRVATNTAPSLLDGYWAVPKVTRFLATGCAATALAAKFAIVNPYHLLLLWPKVVGELQLWRVPTSFLFLGSLSFPWLIQMVWLVQYGKALEEGAFGTSSSAADFPYFVFFGCVVMAALSAVVPYFNIGALAPALVFMFLYLFSRFNPDQTTSVMGLVTIRTFYLPFAFLGLALCGVGGSFAADVLGLVAGHAYYFLKVVHPAGGGRRLLETPRWFESALLRLKVIAPAAATPAAAAAFVGANPSDPGFRPFAGRGRRLAD